MYKNRTLLNFQNLNVHWRLRKNCEQELVNDFLFQANYLKRAETFPREKIRKHKFSRRTPKVLEIWKSLPLKYFVLEIKQLVRGRIVLNILIKLSNQKGEASRLRVQFESDMECNVLIAGANNILKFFFFLR